MNFKIFISEYRIQNVLQTAKFDVRDFKHEQYYIIYGLLIHLLDIWNLIFVSLYPFDSSNCTQIYMITYKKPGSILLANGYWS